MRYLTADEVARFAEAELGPDMLADRFLLEAAVERPQQSAGGADAYPDVHTRAAALLHSIASNHPFVDGNKRMSLLATIAFYGLNSYGFEADDTDLFHVVVDVASWRRGRLTKPRSAPRGLRTGHGAPAHGLVKRTVRGRSNGM